MNSNYPHNERDEAIEWRNNLTWLWVAQTVALTTLMFLCLTLLLILGHFGTTLPAQ